MCCWDDASLNRLKKFKSWIIAWELAKTDPQIVQTLPWDTKIFEAEVRKIPEDI